MAIRVLRYGALKPTAGFDLMLEQIRLAHRYQNKLLEIERWYRAAKWLQKQLPDGIEIDEIRQARNAEVRAARDASGVGWGTYQAAERAAKQACKRWQDPWFSPKLEPRKSMSRMRPRYKRFTGDGSVAACLQRSGCRTDSAVRIEGYGRHRVCRLRVIDDRWIEVPIVLHRDIPTGALVFMGALHVRRVGDRWVYSVTLTIDEPAAEQRTHGTGAVSINFGWRTKTNGDVRIAVCVGDDGAIDECVLPARLIGAMKHHESLRSLADSVAVEFLGSSRTRHRARREVLRGTGPSPLSKLQFDSGGAHNQDPVAREHWARRDRHLYQWECDERESCLLARREIYRLWARKLHAIYASVTIEDFSLAELARQAETPEVPRLKAARHVRFLAAPSYLREEIKEVFGEDCTVLSKAQRTCKCCVCGHVGKYDRGPLVLECERCGASWDQDLNNAENQLTATAAE